MLQRAADAIDQGRLARAVGPDQAEPLALLDLEVDAVERDEAAEALAEPATCSSARHRFLLWNRPTMPCGASDHEGDHQHARDQHVDGRGDRHAQILLQAADQHRADHRPQPAAGAADQRHGDGVDRIVQAEARGRVEIGHVEGQRRAGHAHEAAGQGVAISFSLSVGTPEASAAASSSRMAAKP